jgi:AraC-like DNA-binding protein
MYLHAINYLAFLLIILSLILFLDVVVNFKKPKNLKIVFLLIPFFIIIRNFGYIYLFHFEYNRWLIDLPLSIIGALTVLFLSYLYYNRYHWFYVGFSVTLIFIDFACHIHYSYKLVGPETSLMKVSSNLKLVKLIFITIIFILFAQLFYKIIFSFDPKNEFTFKFKKWLYLLLSIFIIKFLFFFVSLLLNFKIEIYILLTNIVFVSLLYFRPGFFNVINLNIVNNFSFDKKIIKGVSEQLFTTVFFAEKYFLNNEANVVQFCSKLNINPEILKDYTFKNYQLSFIDLINKNRVEHFINLIKSGKYNNYTIEALSQLAGFGSRIHMYNNFKKYHGGTPSDLMRIVNK